MLRDTRRSSKPEYRARYPDARPTFAKAYGSADHFSRREYRCQPGLHRPGCGGSTPPSCRVRVESIAAMQRSLKPQSTGQHRGDPPFPMRSSECRVRNARTSVASRAVPIPHSAFRIPHFAGPHFRIRGEIIIILRFERRVCRWESCRMHQFTGMWLNPNSRGSRLRIWQPWGCKSLHAHHFTATGFSGNSRPRRLKIAEPSGCKSRVADRRVVNRE